MKSTKSPYKIRASKSIQVGLFLFSFSVFIQKIPPGKKQVPLKWVGDYYAFNIIVVKNNAF